MLPKSSVLKRSVIIEGRKTSISSEEIFWAELKRMAAERDITLADLVAEIDRDRPYIANLSSALRCAVAADLLARAFPLRASSAVAPKIEGKSENQRLQEEGNLRIRQELAV